MWAAGQFHKAPSAWVLWFPDLFLTAQTTITLPKQFQLMTAWHHFKVKEQEHWDACSLMIWWGFYMKNCSLLKPLTLNYWKQNPMTTIPFQVREDHDFPLTKRSFVGNNQQANMKNCSYAGWCGHAMLRLGCSGALWEISTIVWGCSACARPRAQSSASPKRRTTNLIRVQRPGRKRRSMDVFVQWSPGFWRETTPPFKCSVLLKVIPRKYAFPGGA